jgi:uncharacterized protein
MNAAEAKEFVLDFFAELTRGEEHAWNRVAEDATWHLMARAQDYPYATAYTKAAYRKLVLDSAATFPTGLEFRITGAIAEDDRVALEAESYGRTRDGRLYNNRYHLFVQLEDGRIKTVREYLDTGHVTEVLG